MKTFTEGQRVWVQMWTRNSDAYRPWGVLVWVPGVYVEFNEAGGPHIVLQDKLQRRYHDEDILSEEDYAKILLTN